jgi:hypothetical protein
VFDFGSQTLPANWKFTAMAPLAASRGESTDGWIAKWGYAELVDDPSHSDSLIEREPSALKIFFQERARRVGLSS